MKEHPIAAGVWLILVVGGLGFLAKNGMEKSAEHREKEEKQQINEELSKIIALGQGGKMKQAIEGLKELVVKHPEEPGLYLNLGVAHRAAGHLEEAEAAFEKTLELDPKDYDAMAERASILLEREKKEEAITLMEKIPQNEGRLRQRLRDDPAWARLAKEPRVKALREKHGVEGYDTSLHMQRMKQKGAPQGVMIP